MEMLERLEGRLLAALQGEPEGLSEHALLKQLQVTEPEGFPSGLFLDPLTLFRAHFLLFHLLYRMRDGLAAAGTHLLEIHPLCIRLRPYSLSGDSALGEHDPLRDYYLEIAHLHNTTTPQVEALLGAFWARLYANQRRHQALAVLELADPVDERAIKQRYRRLAMERHPDRGGDTAAFQALHEAMEVLRRG
jgi:hypothetical protein